MADGTVWLTIRYHPYTGTEPIGVYSDKARAFKAAETDATRIPLPVWTRETQTETTEIWWMMNGIVEYSVTELTIDKEP